ncbi:MAG: hypothetical protein KDA91_17525, partial [Planctomycetaceae bacterium]|nr:hypothetical protein [Planctomycetaceae bacterium]
SPPRGMGSAAFQKASVSSLASLNRIQGVSSEPTCSVQKMSNSARFWLQSPEFGRFGAAD